MDALGIALSGMHAAQTRLATSAHNVSNVLTGSFHPQRVALASRATGGTDVRVETSPRPRATALEHELVEQIRARTQYDASGRVVRAVAETSGRIVDLLA